MKPRISIIVAIGKNAAGENVIGKNNELLWHIPDDLNRFKSITMGHPIIMGRKTYESIGKTLPGRTNIIITRDTSYTVGDCVIVHSLEEALKHAQTIDSEEVFVIGGSQIYKQALPLTHRLYLTVVDEEKEGDSFFPSYSVFTKRLSEEQGEFQGLKYTWVILER